MAFTQTQTLDNILLRGISFRTPANAAISSQYTLYANGQGQTYWSNSVAPPNLSSLSTSIAADVSRLSTNAAQYNSNAFASMALLQNTIQIQGQGIARLNIGLVSTTTVLLSNDRAQSNSITSLSNNFNTLSNQLGNVLAARVDSIFTTTVRYVTSTLYGVSTFSTFYNEISDVRSTTNALFSTLSSTTYIQNASTFTTLTANYQETIRNSILATNARVDDQISQLSAVIANKSDLITLSSVLTNQLLSSSTGISERISTNQVEIDQQISTLYNSTVVVLQQDLRNTEADVFNLQEFSTTISSINNLWISSFVSTSQSFQNAYIYSSIASVASDLQSTTLAATNLANSYSTFSSMATVALGQVIATASKNDSTIKGLQYEFSVITTSSILAGIYDTFMDLEGYTSTLVGSTIATTDTFKSTLYTSTVLQNISISHSYFDFYVSTLYASTLSTLIPSTIFFTSSMVSTLYSTSYSFMTSSLTSTMGSISDQYISTQSSLTRAIILSSQTQLQSSILTYLSTPAARSISTFTARSNDLANQFVNITSALLTQQSTIFVSTIVGNQSTFNTLQNSSIAIIASTNVALAAILSANTRILSTFSTSFATNTSTQLGQFNSTVIVGFPSTFNFAFNSTNRSLIAFGTSSIVSSVRATEFSTLTAFNIFMTGINNQVSTAALSTLYTLRNYDLTGSNFTATLDFANNRNFTVNLYNLIDGSSNYRINYGSNALAGLDMRRGIITLNISTVGSAYTNNNSLLRFDVYRWGIPTTVYGNMYPHISNADYMMQYEYTILNQTLYTNLLNVYPSLAIRSPQVSSIVKNVYIVNNATGENIYSDTHFWRGTPVQIGWSNYSYFPYGMLGAPPYNPEVAIDVLVNNVVIAEYGPYPLSQSTATIVAPYLRSQQTPIIPTNVRTYIVGKPRDYAETTFNTVLPTFDELSFYPEGYPNTTKWIGGTEIVAITDNNRFPVHGANTFVAYTPASEGGGFEYYSNDPLYAPQNIVNGVLNRAGSVGSDPKRITFGASNVNGQFSETSSSNGFPEFYVSLSNYFPDLVTLRRYGSQITFTLSNATNNYTFVAQEIQDRTNNFRISNNSLIKTSNTFIPGDQCFIRYNYTPLQYISTSASGFYNEFAFVGPMFSNTPDPTTFLKVTGLAVTTPVDPVSTLIFYNLSNSPINAISTAGMTINALFTYNGEKYGSTIRTTGDLTQAFRF